MYDDGYLHGGVQKMRKKKTGTSSKSACVSLLDRDAKNQLNAGHKERGKMGTSTRDGGLTQIACNISSTMEHRLAKACQRRKRWCHPQPRMERLNGEELRLVPVRLK